MAERELRVNLDEAIGKATAAVCLQSAFVVALIAKGIISAGDAATVTGVANEALGKMKGLSPGVREMAEATMRGFATSLTKHLTRN